MIGFGRFYIPLFKVIDELLLGHREIAWVLEDGEANTLEARLHGPLATTRFIKSLVDQLDDMKAIKGDLGIGEVLGNTGQEGWRHVACDIRDRGRITTMISQMLGKCRNNLLPLTLCDEEDSLGVEIHEYGDVFMATTAARFIETDASNLAQVLAIQRLLHVPVNDPPQLGIRQADNARYLRHGHPFGQFEDHGFEEERIAAALPGPGDFEHANMSIVASDTRNIRFNVGRMLPEVEVLPPVRSIVMDVDALRAAFWARGQGIRSHIGDAQVQLLLVLDELYVPDFPVFTQTETLLEYVLLIHDRECPDLGKISTPNDEEPNFLGTAGALIPACGLRIKMREAGGQPQAILLSGGGNDFVGGPFEVFLQTYQGEPGIVQRAMVDPMMEGLRVLYGMIIQAIFDEVAAHQWADPYQILINCYAHPVPDGRGYGFNLPFFPGPWLSPGFVAKGYGKSPLAASQFAFYAEKARIVAMMIDRFSDMLDSVAAQFNRAYPGKCTITVIHASDVLDSLTFKQPYPSGGGYEPVPSYDTWWANELHPTEPGFNLVAMQFASHLLPAPVPAPPPPVE
jgi:hypothetical protein